MSSNTPLNNLRNEFKKFKRETKQNFKDGDETSQQIVGLLRELADENKKIIKDLANRTAQVKNLETAVGQLGGFLQNLTGQLLTLEERVSELEEVQGAQRQLQRQPGPGAFGFRMKKSKSRKRRPKKKSRASKKRGKKKSRASKKRGKK